MAFGGGKVSLFKLVVVRSRQAGMGPEVGPKEHVVVGFVLTCKTTKSRSTVLLVFLVWSCFGLGWYSCKRHHPVHQLCKE